MTRATDVGGERTASYGFDAARCEAECAARGLRLGTRIEYKTVTDSTNDDALALARVGAPHGVVVFADRQRQGRGRRGTRWSAAEGTGLLFSVVVRPSGQASELSVLPLVVGLAVRQVVADRLTTPALVKWPNDVLVGGRKICGVLVESHSQAGEVRAVVIGVGLNVRLEPFPPEIAERAVSLEALGASDLSRELLLADLLTVLEQQLRELELHGFAALQAEFARFDFLYGRRVTVGEHSGIARGIADNGALIVECDGVARQVMAGTVSFE